MHNKTALSHVIIGAFGERFMVHTLTMFGMGIAFKPVQSFCGDILYNGKRLEVKTATKNRRGTYQFCLRKRSHCDVSHADYVALILLTDYSNPMVYIIPSYILTTQQITLSETSIKFEQYRNGYAQLTGFRLG